MCQNSPFIEITLATPVASVIFSLCEFRHPLLVYHHLSRNIALNSQLRNIYVNLSKRFYENFVKVIFLLTCTQ